MQGRKKRLALKPFSCSSRRTAELVPAGTDIPQQASNRALKMVWIWKPPAEVSPNQGRSSKALSRRERVLNESEMSLLPSKHRPDSQLGIRRQRRVMGRRKRHFGGERFLTGAELRTSERGILLLPHPFKFSFHRDVSTFCEYPGRRIGQDGRACGRQSVFRDGCEEEGRKRVLRRGSFQSLVVVVVDVAAANALPTHPMGGAILRIVLKKL